jgi:hypothetical protein
VYLRWSCRTNQMVGRPTAAVATLGGLGGCAAGGDGRLYPCTTQTRGVLPSVLQCVRTIHQLWAPSCGAYCRYACQLPLRLFVWCVVRCQS